MAPPKGHNMRLVNLTPHTVNLPEGAVSPSGQVARVSSREEETGIVVCGAPVLRTVYGDVEGLPAPTAGTLYVVSGYVRSRCPDRTDLVTPGRFVTAPRHARSHNRLLSRLELPSLRERSSSRE